MTLYTYALISVLELIFKKLDRGEKVDVNTFNLPTDISDVINKYIKSTPVDRVILAINSKNVQLTDFFYKRLKVPITEIRKIILLDLAISTGDRSIVKYFTDKGIKLEEWMFVTAAKLGDKDFFLFLITLPGGDSYKNSLNDSIKYVTISGDIDFINFLIEQGANDWNNALGGAVISGNKELINFFMQKPINDWSIPLIGACVVGDEELVEYFRSKIPDDNYFIQALQAVLDYGHNNLIHYFLGKRGNNSSQQYIIVGPAIQDFVKNSRFQTQNGANINELLPMAKNGYMYYRTFVDLLKINSYTVNDFNKGSVNLTPDIDRSFGSIPSLYNTDIKLSHHGTYEGLLTINRMPNIKNLTTYQILNNTSDGRFDKEKNSDIFRYFDRMLFFNDFKSEDLGKEIVDFINDDNTKDLLWIEAEIVSAVLGTWVNPQIFNFKL